MVNTYGNQKSTLFWPSLQLLLVSKTVSSKYHALQYYLLILVTFYSLYFTTKLEISMTYDRTIWLTKTVSISCTCAKTPYTHAWVQHDYTFCALVSNHLIFLSLTQSQCAQCIPCLIEHLKGHFIFDIFGSHLSFFFNQWFLAYDYEGWLFNYFPSQINMKQKSFTYTTETLMKATEKLSHIGFW